MEDSSGPARRAIVVGCGIAGPVTAMFLQRAGIDAEIYERSEAPRDEAGAFLNLAPNGVNALASLEIADDVTAIGNAIDGLSFHNAAGKQVGTLDSRNDEQRYGARQVILRRGVLNRTLREAAIALLEWAELHPKLNVRWNAAADIGLVTGGSGLLRIWAEGTLEVKAWTMRRLDPAWDDDGRVDELMTQLEKIDGVVLKRHRLQWPRTPLAPLADPSKHAELVGVMQDVIDGLS